MKKINERPDAATGKTTAMYRSEENVGKTIEKMVCHCIKATKDGGVPYSYCNIAWDGVRYGVSLSLHHIDGKIQKYIKFLNVEAENEAFIDAVRLYIKICLEQRRAECSKSFLKKVKRNCVSLDEVDYATECMFIISAA